MQGRNKLKNLAELRDFMLGTVAKDDAPDESDSDDEIEILVQVTNPFKLQNAVTKKSTIVKVGPIVQNEAKVETFAANHDEPDLNGMSFPKIVNQFSLKNFSESGIFHHNPAAEIVDLCDSD